MKSRREFLLETATMGIAAIVAATRQVVRLKERSHGKG